MNASVPIIGVVIGAAILLFGRKLFWLFVAALGFAMGIAVAGFIAGGRIAWALAVAFWVEHTHYRGITFVIGGILGALLLLALFDWVLILLSSVEGAHLIANGIVLPENGALILFIVLAVIGVVVQGSMLRGSRRTAD
jgi:hypothetical protein